MGDPENLMAELPCGPYSARTSAFFGTAVARGATDTARDVRRIVACSADAAELKTAGNTFFRDENYPKALECFDQALALAPKEPTLWSNK